MRDGLLAFVEGENRPGKEEVTSRSKCPKKMLEGLQFPHLEACQGCRMCCLGCVGVSMPCMRPPICFRWNPLTRLIE